MTEDPAKAQTPITYDPHERAVMTKPNPLITWGWFILKNVLGWVLIVGSVPLGAFIPGPGGIPLFLIGFGLITFPGKRHFTARLMRGIPVSRDSNLFAFAVILIGLLVPAGALLYLVKAEWITPALLRDWRRTAFGIYVGLAALLCLAGLNSHPVVNKLVATFPKMRRKVRPWLRHRGIDLLPRRRRRRHVLKDGHVVADHEILEIHERHYNSLRRAWKSSKPWLRRVLGAAITVAIFVWIFKPIVHRWDAVRERIATIEWSQFFLASAMFAVFLFAFRAMIWRRILKRFGHRVPVAPATRIWSTSELARYLPGVIWQVVGRIYLVKPYGVRGSHCSASQVLELVIFLLANMLVAVACLVWLGIKKMDGLAEAWMYVAMAAVPVLVLLLHPRVLYRLMNGILRRLGKPTIVPRMGFESLAGLLGWTVIGLLFQSLAIWLLVEEPLGGLQLAKWWVVAGAYCLAWCAGFLAFWAPGGLGVRELVFIGAMTVALPPAVRQQFKDPEQLTGVIMFLSVLLRLWATTGELMLAGVAYALDWKGALRGGGRGTAQFCEERSAAPPPAALPSEPPTS
jgi:glycosyltransferase 2 family protein